MTKKILFRADGNSSTGLGHIYRLFSLVEIVKNTYEFIFLTKGNSMDSIVPKAYNKKIIPEDVTTANEPEWLFLNYSPEKYIMIADGYHFNSLYQKQIKEKGFSLIYIDDLAEEHMFADIVINHSPHIQEKHYLKESYTKLALGTQYAMLRPLFLTAAKENRSIEIIDTAFVCFGGADPYDLTFKAVKGLLKLQDFKSIHVVLGGAYKHQDIFNLEKKNSERISTHKNLSEEVLIEVMKKCNFAIAPASTILYELCCVKMPILSGFYVDNQELIYKGFLDNNAIYKGGNMKDYQVSDFVYKTENILKENEFNRQIMSQTSLFDNLIASRHLNLINELCLL